MAKATATAPINVVLGGQYGSEGKGEVVAYLARRAQFGPQLVVRTGGPNAGHTVTTPKGRIKMRHVPAAWENANATLCMSPGALIDPHVLNDEMNELVDKYGWSGVLFVDRHALVITDSHRNTEIAGGMRARIGSTTEGIGAARADKIMRTAKLLKDDEGLALFNSHIDSSVLNRIRIVDVPVEANRWADEGPEAGGIIIESTQGFGLSLEQSGNYPYATSANITPGYLLGEVGLSSRLPHRVTAVMRTFPIRVAGNSGPMKGELTWGTLHTISKGRSPIDGEHTTVTRLIRRVAEWDDNLASRMATLCRPDYIALTFLDYLFPEYADVTDPALILDDVKVLRFFDQVSKSCGGAAVRWVSTGPGKICDLFDVMGGQDIEEYA